jgi:hypothetical protein
MNYYRITAYEPKNDFTFIVDSNGKFEKLWQFSAYLISKGFEVVEVSTENNFIDITTTKVEEDKDHIFLRATQSGKPLFVPQVVNNITYKAVKVSNAIYALIKE